MTNRIIQATGQKFTVIYRVTVERQFATRAEADAYIRAGKFPSLFARRGPSPFRRP